MPNLLQYNTSAKDKRPTRKPHSACKPHSAVVVNRFSHCVVETADEADDESEMDFPKSCRSLRSKCTIQADNKSDVDKSSRRYQSKSEIQTNDDREMGTSISTRMPARLECATQTDDINEMAKPNSCRSVGDERSSGCSHAETEKDSRNNREELAISSQVRRSLRLNKSSATDNDEISRDIKLKNWELVISTKSVISLK